MKRVGLSLLSMLAMALSGRGHAQIACASLNAAGDALQEVRLMRVNQRPAEGSATRDELARLLVDVPLLEGRRHRGAKTALFDPHEFDWYFKRLGDAVAASRTDGELKARRVVRSAVPPEVGMTLVAFLRSEGCVASDEGVRTLSDGGAAIGARYADRQQRESVGARLSEERQRPAASVVRKAEDVPPAEAQPPSRLTQFILPIALIGASLSLAALLFRPWMRQRSYESTPRILCERQGLLLQGNKERKVTIVDYNRDGIRVKHSGLLRRRDASVALAGKTLDGTLVWRNRTYAGFVFELPLDDDTYEWLIDALTGTSADGEDPSISSAA